jgi:cyanate permease
MGIGVSVFFMTVGAILAFAITVPADGIELDTVGVILTILGLVGLLASLVWWDDWTPRPRAVAYEDEDLIVRRRRPRVVTIDDADDDVVDLVEDRPVVERRRVTTRRTTYDGF